MLRTLLAPAVRWTAAVLVTVVSATACDGSGARAATVPVDRVTGVWKAGQATLALTADHTFTASGLNEGKLTETGCPAGHADGDWAFFADQGDGLYVTSRQARSGSEIGLSFTESSDEPCRLTLTVVDDGDTLCATSDPDVPCDLGVRFTRER
ncbi:hypothetical protein QWJ26_19705 [Streptomyces sp. CSDS2]|uniref:hypothetical protein n=1 Tax=Streptomyces sp. CSDS2 TaxID=3055051 RepID=UPI0025AFA263|nr:hypothetical protein [Streptomyces sp. CSDS2]MDN3261995.1 hypothetical protein [Streptomyces sp. CSDS2]